MTDKQMDTRIACALDGLAPADGFERLSAAIGAGAGAEETQPVAAHKPRSGYCSLAHYLVLQQTIF